LHRLKKKSKKNQKFKRSAGGKSTNSVRGLKGEEPEKGNREKAFLPRRNLK